MENDRYLVRKENILRAKKALLAMQRYSWEQGTATQAFLEQGDMDIVLLMVKEGIYRAIPDGRVAEMGIPNAVTDPCSMGESLIRCWELTKDPYFKKGLDDLLEWILDKAPRNADGIIYHFDDMNQMWVDSFYMAPPFLAAAGYYDEALKQIYGWWDLLFLPETGLLAHMWDDDKKDFARKANWGTGNGWAMAGLARVIAFLPDSYADEKKDLIKKVHILMDSALKYMRDDGLFHDVINDPSTFRETNFPQMFAYTIYRGVKAGWIDEKYIAYADKMRKAAEAQEDDYGLIRECCGAPTFDKSGVSPEGQSFFLLMEKAYEDYLA